MRCRILFIAIVLSVSVLHAQRIQASALIGGGWGTKGGGADIKFGTNNEVWDVNVALNISRVKAIEEHLFGPDEEHTYTEFIPYVEVLAYKIIALGIAPYILQSGNGGFFLPLAVLTLSYPIKIYKNIDFLPSFQLMFVVENIGLPRGGFFGAGVAITL